MRSVITMFFVSALNTLCSVPAYASDPDLRKADLQCYLNRSESLYIFSDPGRVVYKHFQHEAVELKLDHPLETMPCAECYSFSGNAGTRRYAGVTESYFDIETQQTAFRMRLVIDDDTYHENVPCLKLHE